MRRQHRVTASGCAIRRGPIAVREIVVIGGVLNDAIQRDVFDEFELFHCALRTSSSSDHRSNRLASRVAPLAQKRPHGRVVRKFDRTIERRGRVTPCLPQQVRAHGPIRLIRSD